MREMKCRQVVIRLDGRDATFREDITVERAVLARLL